jgi:4-amino-4-deoxy-L-arabinose transferase-like glycosyltransferase
MNAEILMLACFSILGRDILVELPQLIAAIGTALLLIFISKEIFKIDYKNGIIASIAILSIPLFWYEAVTTQNDLIFVFAILLAIASLIRLQKKQNKLNLIESILAIALVIGTKYSGLVAGGLLGILLLFILYKNLKFSRKHLLWIVGAGLVSIIIALPNFIIAQLYYGSFLHQPKRVAEQLSPGPETLYTNLKHFLEWFYSAPKYDPIYFSHNTGHAGIWFMLALPFIALILIYNYKKLNAKNVLVLLPVIGFTFIFLLSHYPDPWDLRLMLIFPILTVYFAFTYVINSKDRIIKSFAIFSIFFLFGLNFFTIFRYDYKENLKSATKSLVYDHDFYSVGDDTKHYRWALIPFEAKSLPHTKSNKILYHTKNKDSWVYNFWGEYWQNQLFYVDEFDELIKKGNSQNYDYAVIMQYESLDLNKIPEQWEFLDEDERQVIYKLR